MTFVLAHLSDPHLGPLPKPAWRDLAGKRLTGYVNWIRNRSHEYHRDVADAMVADIKAQTPDHIAVTGDLVNLALPGEFVPARLWLNSLGSPSDVTLVPGNHDTYAQDTRERFASAWGDYMRGDGLTNVTFPFVRRRANVALIGLSTALPTLPFMATGTLGADQIARLDALLPALAAERLFRVILIHHPLRSTSWSKRLTDAEPLIEVLRRHGAELILHGHDHAHSTMWFDGPTRRIPALGIPAASAVDDGDHDPAAYHLIRIDGDGASWRCELTTRGYRPRKARNKPEPLADVFELRRQTLF
jgi:3',5'-cyclic AMP phosphodiesterase CpdA